MKNLIYPLLIILFLTACSSAIQAPPSHYAFMVDGEQNSSIDGQATTKVTNKGLEHEFLFVDFDKSEQSLRFKAKIKNTSKTNKIFNIKDVILVIKSIQGNKPREWKIPARDASLADKDLFAQIADLENKNNNSRVNPDLLVSNLAPKTNPQKEIKSIRERQQELAAKSFYTTNLSPGEVITGLMYFSISDESFLTMPQTTMHLIVKEDKSKDIIFKFKPTAAAQSI